MTSSGGWPMAAAKARATKNPRSATHVAMSMTAASRFPGNTAIFRRSYSGEARSSVMLGGSKGPARTSPAMSGKDESNSCWQSIYMLEVPG